MIRKTTLFVLLAIFFSSPEIKAQFSKENSGEFIFAFSNVERNGIEIPTKMRFTMFLHLGQNLHYNFTNNLGIYSGYGLRNIGIVTEENDIIMKRRTYSLGVPLAIKLGSFKDNAYFYTGGEYALFFHYKQKQYIDGNKSKQSSWFSNRTKRFAPSFFAGLQFPGGLNLKFKYYPENFLNTKFSGYDFGQAVNYAEFNKTQLFYISLSFNFKTNDLKKWVDPDAQPGRIAAL